MGNKYDTEELKKKCKVFGLSISDEQLSQFIEYYELLKEWNTFMNLTAIVEFNEVVLKHFVDSLAVYQFSEFKEACQISEKNKNHRISLIDIGTGAGFPGIPLKIMFPELNITLLDSLQKRICFLDTVIESLNLKNIETIHGRAEDFGKNFSYRERYDFCVSRAVAHLSTLSELCVPFVKQGGYFISYKSEKSEEELITSKKAVFVFGGEIEQRLTYDLPGSDIKRSLIFIKKVKTTPKKYPRKAGIPKKEPIQDAERNF